MDSLGGILTGGLLGNPILSISGYGFSITFTEIPSPTPTPSASSGYPTPTPTPTLPNSYGGGRHYAQEDEPDGRVFINITVNYKKYTKSYIVNKKRISLIIKSISAIKKVKSRINIMLNKFKGK